MSETLSQIIYASQSAGNAPSSNAPLDTWSLTAANGSVIHNGYEDDQITNGSFTGQAGDSISLSWSNPPSYIVIVLYYHNHIVYRATADSTSYGAPGWWSWSGTAWTAAQCPLNESSEGFSIFKAGPVIFASQTGGSAAASGTTLDTFALSTSNQIYHNGVTDSSATNVVKLYYHTHTTYYKNSSNSWFYWNGNSWSSTTAPAGG